MSLKIRRGQKLETRYAYLRNNARILTRALELAAARLSQIARQIDPHRDLGRHVEPLTPSDLRETSSECARIAHDCGIPERGR